MCSTNDLHFDMGLFDDDRPIEQNRPSFTDLKHGWLNGRRDGPPSVSSILRIQGSSRYTVAGYSRLPVADVVTSFVLRRQTRWHIDPDLLEEMIRSFPRLRTLHIEPWRYFDYPGRGLADTKLFKMMSHSLPDTVESFTVFEDFNEDYNTVMFNHGSNAWLLPTELARRPSPNVGRAMARRSQQFKKLAASYVVDAEDFFSATLDATNVCMYSWMHLTSLYLTSRHLKRSTHGTRLSTMLEKAGTAALHMPALRTMHIWNGVKGNVGGFRYEATDESTTIQWRGNWLLHLVPGVVNAWRRVADRWTRKELLVLEPRIAQCRYIGSHAVAMEMLGIHHDVLHPVSFKQIKCETSRYWLNYYSSAS
ncbi:F-box domain-containing protein [Pochonia chlamydosporia 170]|uniref:F-box domain-containing protein n=1 Tax=Pochonia chlamydosporia 170 TaxID=1380566 RepID=A0A179G4R3_METCM|nr:F-box domain-containing protein [Pochonia chlamydosporia 170]OAQ72815.2 F-box domain-containing protein [Pochonia chlamydosporia 170]